jgi:YHS domain-containing protein
LLAGLGFNAFAGAQDGSQKPKEEPLVQVEAKYVCMINNQVFNKEQIAIEVENKTYYGCCQMCKDKLSNDAESRIATDPVSGKKVDKAKAVIGASPDGQVFYFENVENLKRFKPDSK